VVGDVIGFAFRLNTELYLASEWSVGRRASFLLDLSVEWPKSIDFDVWPSIFDDPAASELRRDPLADLLLPPDLTDARQRAIMLDVGGSDETRGALGVCGHTWSPHRA